MALPPPTPSTPPITDPHHMLPAHASEGLPPRRRAWLPKLLAALLLLLIVGYALYRIHENKVQTEQTNARAAAAADRPTPVQTMQVLQQTVPIYLTALGNVIPYNTVTLHSRVDGQLLSVNFREGQHVSKGQLLLQIDPRPYQAAVDQAKGTLAKDEANLKNAQAEAQRYTALYNAGVVSKESQQSQVSTAGQAAGTIAADQAAIEAAKVNLGYTRIYAPIDGVVGLRLVDPGNIVHSADTTGLIVITQEHPISIIFTLPEDQLPQVEKALRSGEKLPVEAYDRTDSHKIASGTLLTIDNQIDTTTGMAKLKAVFDNSDHALFPNQFVNVRLVLSERQNAILVPTAGIESGNQGTFVLVVNPGPTPAAKQKNVNATSDDSTSAPASGKHSRGDASTGDATQQNKPKYHVDLVAVKVDFVQGNNSILAPGALKGGEQVVTDGQEKLVDGSNVDPQAAKQNTKASTGNANDTVAPSQSNGSQQQNPQSPAGGNGGGTQ
jgi:multidrug efflux system membrane fusion protein